MRLPRFTLRPPDQKKLEDYLLTDPKPGASRLTAEILLRLSSGDSSRIVGAEFGLTASTVTRIRNGYLAGGLDAAPAQLTRAKLPPPQESLVRLIQELACSRPPAPKRRWSYQMMADIANERLRLVPAVDWMDVRRVFQGLGIKSRNLPQSWWKSWAMPAAPKDLLGFGLGFDSPDLKKPLN
jgi:hypothetical protein